MAETDSKGNLKAEYTRANSLAVQIRDGKVSYYLYDGHGDVRALLSEAGKITDRHHGRQYLYTGKSRFLHPDDTTWLLVAVEKHEMEENVCPCTARISKKYVPTYVQIEPQDVRGYFEKTSILLVKQIATVDKRKVISKVGHIPESTYKISPLFTSI